MIETARLRLRRLRPGDLDALADLWADPRVMADLGPVKDRAASEQAFARHRDYWKHGFGFWVVERDGAVAGFAGFKPAPAGTPVEGELEAGWMFAAPHWGQGLAHEAMAAAFDWAWATLDAGRIVAITAERNAASRRLMERLGMRHLAKIDFIHPLLADPALARSVVYAIDRPVP